MKPKVHTSQIVTRRGPRGRGWTWVLMYWDQPEASGWEQTRARALLQAPRAKRMSGAPMHEETAT